MPSFVDTNILLYAEDRDAKRKHALAGDLILKLWDDREGVISVASACTLKISTTGSDSVR